MEFAKLFKVSDIHQLLYTLDIDDIEETYAVTVRCDNDGIKVEATITGKTKESATALFEGTGQEQADKMYSSLLQQFVS